VTLFAAALTLALHLFPSANADEAARAPRGAGAELDVSSFPPEQRARYDVFRHKCGGCHSLARAVGSRLPPEAWKRHVRRMGRRPGTALNDEQARSILAFVEHYAAAQRRPPAAAAGAAAPSAARAAPRATSAAAGAPAARAR
jgi:hypothetical protein